MDVRWDAVVEASSFWSEPTAGAKSQRVEGSSPVAPVQVWLFGTLADALPERPVSLRLANPFTVADVIAELGRRCGSEFLSRLTSPDGRKLSHCRVFVNGEPADDEAVPFFANGSDAQVELILLTAAEGG